MRTLSAAALAAAALAAALALAPLAASAQPKATSPAPPFAKPATRAAGFDKGVLAAGAGAITGIVLFNVATGPFATVPLAGAALAEVPTQVALGSRVIATLTAAAGGVLASAAYDKATGQTHDYGYMAALAAGAAGGVLTVNLLSGWSGMLPYYAGSGWAGAGASLSSSAAQAASRIHVIAAGVLGVWAADYLYGLSETPPEVLVQ